MPATDNTVADERGTVGINYFFVERLPKRLLKRSTRPPVSNIFCWPV